MDFIIKDEKLELVYEHGKGAWTYHLRIPNSEHIEGKWGDIKVSGTIDGYRIESRNLAPIKGEDKMLSVNNEIRTAIGKTGGDTVSVTLYLVSRKEEMTETQILEVLKEMEVLGAFEKLGKSEKKEILQGITSQKNEEKQIKIIISLIDKLGEDGR